METSLVLIESPGGHFASVTRWEHPEKGIAESRSVQTMQLCSLGQGTVSPRSIVPRCPRVLQVLPTMFDNSKVPNSRSPSYRHCWKHLQHPGTATAWNSVPWGHCPLSQRSKLHRLDLHSDAGTVNDVAKRLCRSNCHYYAMKISNLSNKSFYNPHFQTLDKSGYSSFNEISFLVKKYL